MLRSAAVIGFTCWCVAAIGAAPSVYAPIPLKAGPSLNRMQAADFPKILDRLASALVGKPYELGPLGEGVGSSHPQPLYRLDAFDCTTYLETVLANAYCFEKEAACLRTQMQRIRYHGKEISFAERNHIPELDWLPHNVRRGYLEDLSPRIFPGEWKKAKITIDRNLWLAKQTGESPKLIKAKPQGELAFLPVAFFFRKAELKPEERKAAEAKLAAANSASATESEDERVKSKFRAELAYLRVTYLPIEERLAQIPSGTVLNLIRRPTKSPGEAKLQTLVAHQGLVVQRTDGAHILHAAPAGHVRDQKLGDYLLRYVRSAHFQGISLYRILPPHR